MAHLVVRPARLSDLDAFITFAERSGPGFTSLPVDRDVLEQRLIKSEKSFAGQMDAAAYVLVIEDADENIAPFGCAAVKTNIGQDVPFFNFRILTIGQMSRSAGRRFDMRTLNLVNDYTGCTEVGTLFLSPDRRGDGAGKLLSLSRFMLMATAPERFEETIVSELRGLVHIDGRSPFWEVVGRPFFRMDFAEADTLSAITDNQFIQDLAPQHPVYVDLLPDAARGAIGETHAEGVAARRMLEREGFRFEGVIDIFDGGPLLAARRDEIRTLKTADILPVRAGRCEDNRRMLIANRQFADFRCVLASARLEDDHIVMEQADMDALKVRNDDMVLVRRFHG